ncbi:uncharacterized protein LOC116176312 isoform X2 [Photinus pyralis]|nr:uncharacterized protein LOC116170395 isoform X2 [Photinus pyralis]XP_031350680.1 uncharacterized protein LOC116176312 isoform X2 [Photinus pyralis]
MLKEFLHNNGGENILEEYDKNKILTNRTRKELVNLTVRMMIKNYGTSLSKEIKVEFAKALVELFPKLKDPNSTKGGYEIFYDDSQRTPSGYLAWRLRTVVRTMPSFHKKRKQLAITTNDPKKRKLSHTLKEQELADIEFLKNACTKTQKHEIFQKMKNTLDCRINNDFSLNDYPRFLDTPGLIEQDFTLLYPNANQFDIEFEKYVNKILAVYEATISNKSTDIEAWDKNTQALLAILHMLPSTAKGRKSGGYSRDTLNSLFQKLIVFSSVGDPLEAIIGAAKGSQPYLIAIGSNKAAIHDFKVVVDNKFLETGQSSILQAFDFLFKTYFVFKIKFDVGLETFFTFIQDFFYNIETDNIHYTTKMRELKNRILNF